MIDLNENKLSLSQEEWNVVWLLQYLSDGKMHLISSSCYTSNLYYFLGFLLGSLDANDMYNCVT